MIIAAVTLYSVSVFLHVTAVVVGFGSTFAESLMFPVALKLSNRHLPYVHRLQLAINQRLATPAVREIPAFVPVVVAVSSPSPRSSSSYSLASTRCSPAPGVLATSG